MSASPQVSVYTTTNPAAGGMRLDSKDEILRFARHHFGWREDAGLTVAFARGLETILAKTYEARFAAYRAFEFFAVSTEVGSGDLAFTYRMYSRIGNAQVIDSAGASRNLPNIDIGGQETQSPVITIGASYQFSVIDERASQKINYSIEAAKARACREAMAALVEQIMALGYPSAGIVGVTNAPGVQGVTQVSTGTWQSQIKAVTTAAPSSSSPFPAVQAVAAIAGDITAMCQQIFTNTIATQKANRCLLPINLYQMIDTLPQSPAFNGLTALQFLENITGCKIDWWPILSNAGSIAGSPASLAGGTALKGRVLVYDDDPEVLQLMVAQTFVQLAPQPVGLTWTIPCYERIGGAMSVRPLGACWMDGL